MPTEHECVTTMRMAEYWGDLIRDCLIHLDDDELVCEDHEDPLDYHDGHDRLNDLTLWLHEAGNGGEGHWFGTAPWCCVHIFSDGSIMDCEHGDLLTFEKAVEEISKMLVHDEVEIDFAGMPAQVRHRLMV